MLTKHSKLIEKTVDWIQNTWQNFLLNIRLFIKKRNIFHRYRLIVTFMFSIYFINVNNDTRQLIFGNFEDVVLKTIQFIHKT